MIRLRPYHLFAVVRQIADGPHEEDEYFKGMPLITKQILDNPDEELMVVEEFDDMCLQCTRRAYDPQGSIWGPEHSCPSALRADRAYMVGKDMERILRKLDIEWGTTMPAKAFIKLAVEKFPERWEDKPEGEYRKSYILGIEKLKEMGWL